MVPKIELFMLTTWPRIYFMLLQSVIIIFSVQFVVKQRLVYQYHRLPLVLCATQAVSYRNKDRLLLSGLHN